MTSTRRTLTRLDHARADLDAAQRRAARLEKSYMAARTKYRDLRADLEAAATEVNAYTALVASLSGEPAAEVTSSGQPQTVPGGDE